MADNLAISITGDVSDLQPKLALARAEVQEYAREVRQPPAVTARAAAPRSSPRFSLLRRPRPRGRVKVGV